MRGIALTIAMACGARALAFDLSIVDTPTLFAPGIASTAYSDVRLTISPDGRLALWFSRNRPGGAGGYDIWMARRGAAGWEPAAPVPFNSASRDFDPAFSADGRDVYFCSDRAGGVGGDDIYRVAVSSRGFGQPELLGREVNSSANEWAPMLSPDSQVLLFSSNGRGGAGRMDLFTARRRARGFAAAVALPGGINSEADEFDATFLADGATIVFSRSRDLAVDAVRLLYAWPADYGYAAGVALVDSVRVAGSSEYGATLDWSQRDRFTFTAAGDLYVVRYRLE
jgi:Tol biopolymer transport system component